MALRVRRTARPPSLPHRIDGCCISPFRGRGRGRPGPKTQNRQPETENRSLLPCRSRRVDEDSLSLCASAPLRETAQTKPAGGPISDKPYLRPCAPGGLRG
jgi:hypothetical protein